MPSNSPISRVFHAFLLIIASVTIVTAQNQTKVDSLSQVSDSLTNVTDTTQTDSIAPKQESGFKSKVDYNAADSMIFDIKSQKMFLYGKGEVDYETTNLKANFIELDLKKNEVYAVGTKDSADNVEGSPVFKDKGQEFEADAMRYNFDTKKGLITEAVTQQGDGYIVGGLVKKQPDNVIYIQDGKLCPCKDRDAITHINAKKIKIIPNDKVVTGAANLKLGNIPTPLMLPFAILPNKKGASSGVILPQYGFSPDQGLFLQNGGFYWAFNDYVHFEFTGDIYSRGSWGLGMRSNYNVRYKFKGNTDFRYTNLKTGSAETKDLREEKIYKIYWRHQQDPKANPYQSFSADINIYKNNRLDINSSAQDYLSNTFKSNLNYTRKFGNSPFRLTANASYEVSSNTNDSIALATLELPNLTLNMDRIYPFKRKNKVGRDKWYEKIGLTYSSQMKNRLRGDQDSLFNESNLDNVVTGFRHQFGVNTNYKVMKVFSLQPYINYTETWELKNLKQSWNPVDSSIAKDTIREFGRYGTMSAGANLSTKVYGTFVYRSGPIKAIRHVMTPAVGFRYAPDYRNRPYVEDYYRPTDSTVVPYSTFDGSVGAYGTAPIGKQTGSLTFDLRNNLEMKVKSKKDTVKGTKKVKLLDQLNFSSAYDLFADSMNWSDVSIVANTKLFNFFQVNYSSQLNLYALDSVTVGESSQLKTINQFEYAKTGKLGRFTGHRLGVNFTLSNKKQQEKKKSKLKAMNQSPVIFSNIPWTMSVGYTYNYSKPKIESTQTQSVMLRSTVNLTQNWKFEFMTNFDFELQEIAYSRFSIYRDLNCWEARISVNPKGGQQQYNFSINLKPQMFKDLKVERKRNYYDFN